jgi:hypothetical protein
MVKRNIMILKLGNWTLYDAPIDKEEGTAITSSWIFRYWFWTKLHKESWANDYTSGGTSFNGSGNDFPMMVLVILFFSIGLFALEKFFRKKHRKQDF